MAVRKDEIQLSINFITDESKQYAKLINQNKQFIKDLNRAKRKGEDMGEAINKIVRSGQSLAGIDLSKLMPSQLVQRARQISQTMRLIPWWTASFFLRMTSPRASRTVISIFGSPWSWSLSVLPTGLFARLDMLRSRSFSACG